MDAKAVQLEEADGRLVVANGLLEVRCDLAAGTWDCRGQGATASGICLRVQAGGEWFATRGVPVERWEQATLADGLGEALQLTLHHRVQGGGVGLAQVLTVYRARPCLAVEVRVTNGSDVPVPIGGICPAWIDAEEGGRLDLGPGVASSKLYLESNNIYGAAVVDLAGGADRVHQSGWLGLVYNPESEVCLLGGFATAGPALGKVVTCYRPEVGIARWYGVCQYDDLLLAPGQTLASERFWIDLCPDPFAALETFADAVAVANRIEAIEAPQALWCSWYAYRLRLTEDDVLRNARVVAERFRPYGVTVMQLDYGWNHLDTPGEWSHHRERFSHGLSWLRERLEAMGLDLGLWLAPFIVFEGCGFCRQHPNCVIRDPQGRPAPWQTDWPWEPKVPIYDLDLRTEEARGFVTRVFAELAALGIGYVKLDFLNGPSAGPLSFEHGIPNEVRVRDGERTRIGLSLVRQALGQGSYVLACNVPHSHCLGLASATFAALDVGNAYLGAEASWQHFRKRTSSFAARYYQQGKLWRNDPDVVYLGGNPPDFSPVCDLGEARARLTAAALSGGPAVLGDNLAALPPERLEMHTLCLPPYGVAARPVDLFDNPYPRVWDLRVDADWGQWHVVGVFNYEADAGAVNVAFGDLGLASGQTCLVWEFWEGRFHGLHDGAVAVTVPGRDARLLVVKPAPPAPTVLSTSFHVTQGGVELSGVRWDDGEGRLAGTCRRAPGARGELVLWAPEGYRLEGCRRLDGGDPPDTREVASGVWKVHLELVGASVGWEARFGR